MSSAADIEIWHSATQAYDSGKLQEAVSMFSSMSTISSKIYFNIGIVYFAQQNNKDALKNFEEAVKKDAHFAVGYYMTGICNCKDSKFSVAIEQFQQAVKCMRGNKLVDYKQLGLKYQLYECEVLVNQAFAYSKQGEVDKARDSLSRAIQVKVEKRHESANEALQQLQAGKQLDLVMPPASAIFRPSAQAVKNLKKKDYLGKAKVLYTADPTDNTSGFSGLKLERQKLMSDLCEPTRKQTLRRVSAPCRPSADILPTGKVIDNKPPQKALPPGPHEGGRQRKQTWAGVITKPMPMPSLPEAPTRPPPRSPLVAKRPEGSSWDGQKSQNSAFMENGTSQSPKPQPPNKPLPTGPKSTNDDDEQKCPISIEVQFSFAVKLACNEMTTISELNELIQNQSIPRKMDLFYVDGLGRQKKLSQASLDHILQGSIDNAKIMCFEAS